MKLTREHLPILQRAREMIENGGRDCLFICLACCRIAEQSEDERTQILAAQVVQYIEHEIEDQPYLTSWVMLK